MSIDDLIKHMYEQLESLEELSNYGFSEEKTASKEIIKILEAKKNKDNLEKINQNE